MIRLIFFDLGETLIHNGTPFPFVLEALQSIAEFKDQSGAKLFMGIVSDFGEPEIAKTESQIRAFETDFTKILQKAGLEQFFQPVDNRVTISARAGAAKPDRRVFEVAAKRSGLEPELSECLFITENQSHLAAARGFGMSILGFGENFNGMPSFANWLDAPMSIADIIDPENVRNQERAITLVLKKQHPVGSFKCLKRTGGNFQGQAMRMVQLESPELGALSGAFVEMPVDVAVRCDDKGTIDSVRVAEATDEDIEDAVSYVQQLVGQGQVSEHAEKMPKGATHAIEIDDQGRRVIVRQRFSH